MRPVLGQPTIPRLHVTELAFDDAEGMLDLCTHLGDDPVDLFVDGVELAALAQGAANAERLLATIWRRPADQTMGEAT